MSACLLTEMHAGLKGSLAPDSTPWVKARAPGAALANKNTLGDGVRDTLCGRKESGTPYLPEMLITGLE